MSMDFTHDLNSVANFHTDGEWVKGAHRLYPVTETAPREDPEVPAMADPEDPLVYFTKMFGPPRPGYSTLILPSGGGEDGDEEEGEEGEEGEGGEEGGGGDEGEDGEEG